MKRKLISIILCVAMLIPCVMLNTFAQENAVDSGKVLYYQQFGKIDDDLIVNNIPSAGLRNGYPGITSIDEETGYLSAKIGSDTTRKNLVFLDNIIPEDGTYTVEFTYRVRYGRYNASSVSLGWGTEKMTLLQFTGNAGLLFSYEGSESVTQSYTENFGKDVIGFTGSNSEITGNWVTAKVEVTEDVLTGHSFIYDGTKYDYDVDYSIYNGEKIDADDLYFRGYSMNTEFSSIRVVKGVGYTEYKGAMATASYSEITNDNTLYYQRFGKSDNGDKIVTSIPDAGMTAVEGGSIGEDGYYHLNSGGNARKIGSYLNFNLPETDTYTVELAYRYTAYANSNSSAFQIGWGECETNKYHLLQFQTGGGLKFTDYDTANNGTTKHEPTEAWPTDAKAAMSAINEWINVTVVVENSKIVKCIFTVDGYTFEMDNTTLGFNTYVMENNQLYFRIYNAQADVSYIRITEGAIPTEYRGVYGTTSYNGYDDPAVSNVGMQKYSALE